METNNAVETVIPLVQQFAEQLIQAKQLALQSVAEDIWRDANDLGKALDENDFSSVAFHLSEIGQQIRQAEKIANQWQTLSSVNRQIAKHFTV